MKGRFLALAAAIFFTQAFVHGESSDADYADEKSYHDAEWAPGAYTAETILGYAVVPLKKKREILDQVIPEAWRGNRGLPDAVLQRPGALEDHAAQIYDATLSAEGYLTDDNVPRWSDGARSLQSTLNDEISTEGRRASPRISKLAEGDVVPFCVDILKRGNNESAWSCAGILDRMRSRAGSAVPQLLNVFTKPDWSSASPSGYSSSLHEASFDALSKIDPPSLSQLRPILEKNLTSGESSLRTSSADFLLRIGTVPASLTGPVFKTLLASDFQKALDAMPALIEGGAERKKIVRDTLLSSLSDESKDVRKNAAMILRHVGKWPEAEPCLLKSLADKDKTVREQSAFALNNIGPSKKSIPGLLKALKEDNQFLTSHALRAMGAIGADAKRLEKVISKYLFSKSTIVRLAAADSLGKIGVSDNRIVDQMAKAAEADNDPSVRQAIVSSLKKIGTPKALEAVKMLRKR